MSFADEREGTMIGAKCHYEVFCLDDTPFEPEDPGLIAMIEGEAQWERVERSGDAALFSPPSFGAPGDDQPERFRRPVKGIPSGIAETIGRARVCYRITCDKKEPEDFGYLEAAIALSGEIASQREGVVVDRLADIGYSAEEMLLQREFLAVRDTVSVDEELTGNTVRLFTSGMAKFGQRDFLVEDFPAEHIEIGRRLLFDNLCHYAAFSCNIGPGENMQYLRADPKAKWFFSEAADGRLLVSDCHPEKKKPIPGLNRFIEATLPTFQKEMVREKAKTELLPAAGAGVHTMDDYVELMALLDADQTEQALVRFGLTLEDLREVLDDWSERLDDPDLAAEFSRKLDERQS
jgi:hypothetical protein